MFLKFDNFFMEIEVLKQKLHSFIESVNDENVLLNLWHAAEGKQAQDYSNEEENLSKEDYEELLSLVNEPSAKDTICNGNLKASLSRWFTK
jgi:hypothetical protein